MSQLRRYSVILCCCALTAGTIAVAARGEERAVAGMPEDVLPGLKTILQQALNRSPDTIARGIELEQAEARIYMSRGAMLPNIGGYMRYALNEASTVSSTSRSTNSSSGFFYEANVNQPVYHWGALKAQLEIDKLGVKIAQRQFAEAYRALATLVRARYLDLIAKKAALRSSAAQMKLAATGLAREEERRKNNQISEGEIAGLRMTFQEAQLGFDRTTADFDYLKRTFLRLAGLDELADDAIPLEVPAPAPATDNGEGIYQAFLRGGAAETYRAQVFGLTIKQSDLTYAIAKTRLYPKFSFYTGLSQSNSTQVELSQVHQEAIAQRYVGVVANWTIFDGLATRGAKLEALAKKRASERQLVTYIDATNDAAKNLQVQVGFAARALEFAEARLAMAKKSLELTKQNLERGIAVPDDVSRTEAAILAAEAAAALARGEYFNRWTEFVSLVGADPAMNNLPSRYVR